MPIDVSFVRVNLTVSPSCTLMTGPGAVPLNVHTWYFTSGAISCVVSRATRSTSTMLPLGSSTLKSPVVASLAVLPSPGLTATIPTTMRIAARNTAPAETNLFMGASWDVPTIERATRRTDECRPFPDGPVVI